MLELAMTGVAIAMGNRTQTDWERERELSVG